MRLKPKPHALPTRRCPFWPAPPLQTFINGEKQRTWREHFGGDGLADEAAQWPPAWVRLCSNPRCGSFAGSCEKDLGLKACTRCRWGSQGGCWLD